jgi:hypothetical protein
MQRLEGMLAVNPNATVGSQFVNELHATYVKAGEMGAAVVVGGAAVVGAASLIPEEAAGALVTGAVTLGRAGLAAASSFGRALVSAGPALAPRLAMP